MGRQTELWRCNLAEKFDVIIIGAGASGLMCAAEAGKRGRRVLVVDHAAKPGQKLLVTGGGRCNFTNRQVDVHNFISRVPKFCKSALSRFSPRHFIAMLEKKRIAYGERSHGQLFCTGNASQILDMLLEECHVNGVVMRFGCHIHQIIPMINETASSGPKEKFVSGSASKNIGQSAAAQTAGKSEFKRFSLLTSKGEFESASLVIASGGLSFPETGASGFGIKVAEQFELQVVPVVPGLVPLTLNPQDKEKLATLSGIAVEAVVSCERQSFRENVLFTHRGLSGPAILQISSYWRPGGEISINFLPDIDLVEAFSRKKLESSLTRVKTVVAEYLPRRLVEALLPETTAEKPLAKTSLVRFKEISAIVQGYKVKPAGSEGYRTAEVMLGGVDCSEISSKTFAAHKVAGLYFIGEILDVTGWLGGYNLQWAWSSGWCAGQFV